MGCNEGNCNCGKGNQSALEENIRLVQLSTGKGLLPAYDWMNGQGSLAIDEEVVEIRFKNNRKEFFRNRFSLTVSKGDRIAVEAEGGHDLGTVSLSGMLAEKQYLQKRGGSAKNELRAVLRIATEKDTYNWLLAKRRERNVLREARNIAFSAGLEMHINDVEFQGDGRKVNIYYSADHRIDFRELIREYSAAFRVRIEMKQI